ncbi:uncharacterized protein FIBRA_02969 [Fibroporia radiculosa]|uniref:DUF1764-domain-containing protein n=1 Tax=Fibroporia radiculosa TaxID=599839 RepID=J4G3N3_9APHY|nr:uncharacterized protein FIBRA_02969 [Fibroporia radiculosa]CCM00923.1 predicted protein [Fibroporia radiculosa]
MPPSEIDAIFASKRTPAPTHPSPSTSTSTSTSKKPKRPPKRKRGPAAQSDPEDDASSLKKHRHPETVLDPSIPVTPVPSKQSRKSNPRPPSDSGPARKKGRLATDDVERFRDSRGTGPRRKTEEGFAIYKEDELGINDQGGDTPLCPFDCQCCESHACFSFAAYQSFGPGF